MATTTTAKLTSKLGATPPAGCERPYLHFCQYLLLGVLDSSTVDSWDWYHSFNTGKRFSEYCIPTFSPFSSCDGVTCKSTPYFLSSPSHLPSLPPFIPHIPWLIISAHSCAPPQRPSFSSLVAPPWRVLPARTKSKRASAEGGQSSPPDPQPLPR